jgi:UDP-glucose 4-epimerase
MAILVTGGAGYIGSVTVELFRQRGEQVVVLDNLSRGHEAAVPSDVQFYKGDIGDRDLVQRITRDHAIKASIHFAAFAYVGESVVDPGLYYSNNVAQGITLLDALCQAGVKRVVFSSTCATYGEPQRLPIDETHPQQPTNPYGWSKLFMERIMTAYDAAYGLKFVALRYFNAAGATARCGEEHDPEPHLIPLLLKVARGEIPYVSVFGDNYATSDGTCVRDYIHVSDLADAHILALDYLRAGGDSTAINLGNGNGYSVLEVIEAARLVTKKPIAVKIELPRLGDPSHLVADATKARETLNWKPIYPDLSSMIASAWQWHNGHSHGDAATQLQDHSLLENEAS